MQTIMAQRNVIVINKNFVVDQHADFIQAAMKRSPFSHSFAFHQKE